MTLKYTKRFKIFQVAVSVCTGKFFAVFLEFLPSNLEVFNMYLHEYLYGCVLAYCLFVQQQRRILKNPIDTTVQLSHPNTEAACVSASSYLLQVSDGLLQILGPLILLLPNHVLLLLVQETNDVGNFRILVHIKGQVVQWRDRLAFSVPTTKKLRRLYMNLR